MARKKTAKKKTSTKIDEKKGKDSQAIEVKVKIVEVDVKAKGTPIKFKNLPFSGAMNRRAGNWIDQEEKLIMTIILVDGMDDKVVTTTKITKLVIERGKRIGMFEPLNFTSVQLEKISNIIKAEQDVTLILQADNKGLFEKEHGDAQEKEENPVKIEDAEDREPELDFDD